MVLHALHKAWQCFNVQLPNMQCCAAHRIGDKGLHEQVHDAALRFGLGTLAEVQVKQDLLHHLQRAVVGV